ncbi:universal stress protein [uncultured Cohaesibacter sp.]|uniref:universal stress protein n=1 Tax=uncultured Cohaesibacter sp. TaxID=1002546 RepID=UPI0029C6260E|nr:universal stress protein [uncultured Cohaesibacter sp.]
MTIKSILCAYSGEQAQGSGLDHAIKLAKHHDAWLTGILRHGRSRMDRRIATIVSKDVHQALHTAEEARVAEVMRRFDEKIRAHGLSDRSDYIDLMPSEGFTLPEIARTYDLIVTGHHSDDEDDEFMAAHPDVIALQSGRPVLVVPDGYAAKGLADHALVAWDGKRSAARAIGDAMHILEGKAKVTILTVGDAHRVDNHPGGGILSLLKRHDIEAEHLHRKGAGQSIAQVIEDTAEEIGAKLIVMGAFEHSKFAHDLFGGVTTEIIKTVGVPVFMAH